ncbi:MAG TPA: lipopolysaccharide biosynthesis protein [Candidatus Sulfotelmatobacter sp.]
MDHSLAHSLAWKAAGDWISQIFSWAALLIIVRLLSPSDFGIVAMGMVLLPYLRCVGASGVPRIIVNFPDLPEDHIAQLNTLSLILGIACFAIAVVLAYPAALFFRESRLVLVVIVTSSSLIPWGIRGVSEGLLDKEMRFRLLSIYDGLFSVLAAIVTLVMAYLGLGYWALAWGNVVGIIVRSGLIVMARPYRYAIPRFHDLRGPLLFGWHILVSLVAMNSYHTLDNVTVGRVLGGTALGFYGLAWTLANVPLEKVTSLVTSVVPSYLAVVQNSPEEVRRYVRTLTEALSFITFPATVGLGLVAREMIPVVLGRKWDGAILPLEILSVYAAFRSIVALLPKVLAAVGNARFVMWSDLFAIVVMPTAFYVGTRWGTAGVAWAWVVAYPLVAGLLYWKTFSVIGMKSGDYIGALRPALDGTIVMSGLVLLLKGTMPQAFPPVARLAIEIVAGVLSYAGAAALFHRERMNAFLEFARGFRRGRHQG